MKVQSFSGCKSRPAKVVPAGELSQPWWRQRNRGSLGDKGGERPSAERQAVTRVNTEQAPKDCCGGRPAFPMGKAAMREREQGR